MRRICHVLSSLEVGGAETLALRVAGAQRDAGHDVRVLAVRPGPLAAACRDAGLPLDVLDAARLPARLSRALGVFARRRPDVVHTHNHHAHRYALVARAAGLSAVVLTLHGETSARETGGLWATRALLDGVIACSAQVAAGFRARHPRWPPARLRVIENGVPLPAPAAPAAVRLPGHALVVCVARLDPLKDLATLVRAVAALPAVQLALVGDGAERPALEALARELGAAPRVAFLGWRRDVAALLAAADVFALSSVSEGMPLAALEAMAAGLPVVATAVGGMPEVVAAGETGLLVPPRDPPALARAIAALLDDEPRRRALGAAGRERVRARFSLDATARRYLEAYDEWRPRRGS